MGQCSNNFNAYINLVSIDTENRHYMKFKL